MGSTGAIASILLLLLITLCEGGIHHETFGENKVQASLTEQDLFVADMTRTKLMYPYNLSDFTEITSTKPLHDQPLPFRLPFFGFNYHYIWIQRDGYIGFNKGLLSYKFPVRFPVLPRDPYIESDPSIIAPWFALQDIPTEVPNAGVYLKIVNLETEFNQSLRHRIYSDFSESMTGAINFKPRYAIIVTWRNMTMVNRRPEMPLKTNTYQCVLATDEIRTYAMFNYEQIEWITHMDNYEGLKGSAAYVGFNAGNTTRTFEYRPYSQHPRISYLTTRGYGNGLQGRHYFEIDEEIWPGCCIETDLDPNLPDRLPLTFYPRSGHMLGGTVVNITGPCLKPTSIMSCKFENWRTPAIYRDINQATCIAPAVLYHGYVDLTFTVDDRTHFMGQFYIEPSNSGDEDIAVLHESDRLEEPKSLEIKWNSHKLAWDDNARVTVSLWGYQEQSGIYPHLSYIDTLAAPGSIRLGQNKLTLDPFNQFKDRDNKNAINMTFGFIAINITDPTVLGKNLKTSPTIWSRALPLSWYFKPQWERHFGGNGSWKDHFCNEWSKSESIANMKTLVESTAQCPCTLRQAEFEKGRFLPDQECNVLDRQCDTFHQGALACYRTGRPSTVGSGQTCCYDDYGELIRTVDSMYGGRPSRADIDGKHPFKTSLNIPFLSNWQYDTMPFFFCCKWSQMGENSKSCQKYNKLRSSQDCSGYTAPAVGSVFGDPHVITFDGLNYTFNGKGEYTLLQVNNSAHRLDVQGRFEQVPKYRRTDPAINATALTAVVARENQSAIVEFRLRPSAAQWKYRLYAIVDKQYVYWTDTPGGTLNFRGVTLYQPAGIQNMSHIIAMFDSGAGVEVMVTGGHLTVHVYAPATFINGTAGLLGKYSKDIRDDFTLANGQSIPVNSNQKDIHVRFGQSWRLKERVAGLDDASLFYHDAVPFAAYDDPNFVPEFNLTLRLPDWAEYLRPEMESVCAGSLACRYDYIMTFDGNYAKTTKNEESYAQALQSQSRQIFRRCPALPRPLNGRKSENRYWPGTIVRFACDKNFKLNGTEGVRCSEKGQWSGSAPTCISV